MPAGKKRRFEDLSREQLIAACYGLARQCASLADEYSVLETKLVRTNSRLGQVRSELARIIHREPEKV